MSGGRKWGKVGKVAIIFFTFILLAAGFAYSRTDLGEAASKYDQNLEAAKKAGLCFTGQDASKLFEVSDKDNGALLLGDVLKAIENHHLDSPYQIDKYSDQEIIDAWEAFGPDLPTLRDALSKPKVIFPRKFTTPEFYSKNFHKLAALPRLIVRRARIAAKHDDIERAADLLSLAARLSVHLADEPTLDGMMFRASSASTIEKELRRLIASHGHDRKWLAVLDDTLAILDRPYDVRRVLQYEHWSWLWVGKILLGDNSSGTLTDLGQRKEDSLPNITYAGKSIPRFRTANLSRFHEYYVEALLGIPNDQNDFVGITKSMMKAYSGIDSSDTSVSFSFLRFQPMSTSSDVGSIELVELVEVETTQRNVLLQTLAFAKSGANPAHGLPLSGRFAMDCGGLKLGLDHTKDGWIVYSVGKDGKDDHLAPPPAYSDDFIVPLVK